MGMKCWARRWEKMDPGIFDETNYYSVPRALNFIIVDPLKGRLEASIDWRVKMGENLNENPCLWEIYGRKAIIYCSD